MRFSLFVHMERVTAEESQQQLYEEMIAQCEIADRGGMHAVWTGEHHGMNFTMAPNPLLNLVDLARRTRNGRLGTGTVIAPFWHPIRLAGEAAMADIIMDSRLDLRIARGAYYSEYERLSPGLDAWGTGGRIRELIPAVKKLWEGDYECAKYPEQPRPKIMVQRHTYLADSEDDAVWGADKLNRFCCYFGAWFKNERPISQGLIATLTEAEIAAHPFYSPEIMRKNNIVGEAADVIARVKSYEALGYDEFSFWIDSGMSFARKKASLERFISNVMPAFT